MSHRVKTLTSNNSFEKHLRPYNVTLPKIQISAHQIILQKS